MKLFKQYIEQGYKNSFILFLLFGSSILNSQTLTPPNISASRGFYENSFVVSITSNEPNTSIKYTLDGSNPISSNTALIVDSTVSIQIDPISTDGQRGKTPGVILRACCISTDNSFSTVITNTYLFVNKVVELSQSGVKPGNSWPNPTTSGNSQWIDYGMSNDVVNDPRCKDSLISSLLSIPTISIATDLKNLFDPNSGIYMNAYNSGIDWERPASIELLNPDGSTGFQIDAGIRIRGGASRSGNNPKHAFRLFFRKDYGDGKLNFPLFGNEGVNEFDKVDLRTSQNYSWSFPDHLGEYNTMNRDVFSRDLQGKMGQPYTRSRYYHLYINGVYWGLYQTQERSEASYAASYFGGDADDYDVVKVSGGWPGSVEVTDGNLDAYKDLWNLCNSGFKNNIDYFKLQGLNEGGTPNPDYKNLVDIDNLIDFMLIVFYTGNFDCPITKFGQNNIPRNFYCIYNRKRNDGFKFFVHDAEHSLRTTAGEGPGSGLNENRVNIGNLTSGDSYKMIVNSFSQFHPQWLHFRLCENEEYKIRFADHVYKYFFNDGCMTPGKAAALFLSRAKGIESAVIAESARWGDTYHTPARNKYDDWQPSIDDIVKNYFPVRTNIVLNQLKGVELYPTVVPPIFKNNNTEVISSKIITQTDYLLRIEKQSSAQNGQIYYTTNNDDPRNIGGAVSNSAIDANDGTDILINTNTVIKARILNGTKWSALHELNVFTNNSLDNIKITEINYHPLDEDSISDNEYEFLELKNTGTAPIDISGTSFIEAIKYTFPENTIIQPKKFFVIASNKDEFNNRYGFLPFGKYLGQLDNSGETIIFEEANGDTVFSITYDDKAPWPVSSDGEGYSLVPKELNPTSDLNDPENWRPSYNINGSPGKDDIATTDIQDELEVPKKFDLQQNFPNPFNPSTKIKYSIAKSGNVSLKIYNILGQTVITLINGYRNAGHYQFTFDASKIASGIYFYKLIFGNSSITKKMLLIR